MKLYEGIKEIGKRLILPVVLAVALASGGWGCGKTDSDKSLPISPENRESFRDYRIEHDNKHMLEQNLLKLEKVDQYNRGMIGGVGKFNDALEDRILDREEQVAIYSSLRQPVVILDELKKNNLESEYPEIRNSGLVRNLYSLIDKNLHGLDLGTSELEIELRKQGYDVKVETNFSDEEFWIYGLPSFALACMGMGLIADIVKKPIKSRNTTDWEV